MREVTSLLEEGQQYGEEPGEFGTLPLQHCAFKKRTQYGKVKITKDLGASNPADLGTQHLEGGSIRRALEKCHFLRIQEITRQHSMMQVNLTRSQTQLWNWDNKYSGTQRQWCKPNVNRHALLHKQNVNKLQCHATDTVRCQPDHDNTYHIPDHKRFYLHDFTKFCTEFLKKKIA